MDPSEVSRQRITPRYSPTEYRVRPKDYDPKLCDEILEHIMNGEMITQVCERDHMPLPGTFLRWCAQDPHLQEQYHDALKIQVDILMALSVVASQQLNTSAANVQSNAFRTYAEKMHPEKYGKKSTINIPDPKEPEHGGINHAAEVRRKLDEMAKRLASSNKDKEDPKPGS